MKSALFAGTVYHKRLRPTVHVLRYRVFSFLLALDEIDELQKKLWLFSRNRWNIFSFYDKDFGEKGANESESAESESMDSESIDSESIDSESIDSESIDSESIDSESLEQYVIRHLNEAGIEQKPHRILLSCYPRICGYTFNPLSLFYCLDENDQPIAILHEVHNTFGERHVYALEVSANDRESGDWINQTASKALFVSPFAHMNMHYEFRLNIPDERQVLVIRAHDEHGHLITASYTAKRQALNAATLLRYFLTIPLLTTKVVVGIHWEALRLWIKKVPWFTHQPKQPYSGNNLKNP